MARFKRLFDGVEVDSTRLALGARAGSWCAVEAGQTTMHFDEEFRRLYAPIDDVAQAALDTPLFVIDQAADIRDAWNVKRT